MTQIHVWSVNETDDEHMPMPPWPDGWPVPSVGERVGYAEPVPKMFVVADVFWLPDNDEPEPGVWVTLVAVVEDESRP